MLGFMIHVMSARQFIFMNVNDVLSTVKENLQTKAFHNAQIRCVLFGSYDDGVNAKHNNIGNKRAVDNK